MTPEIQREWKGRKGFLPSAQLWRQIVTKSSRFMKDFNGNGADDDYYDGDVRTPIKTGFAPSSSLSASNPFVGERHFLFFCPLSMGGSGRKVFQACEPLFWSHCHNLIIILASMLPAIDSIGRDLNGRFRPISTILKSLDLCCSFSS